MQISPIKNQNFEKLSKNPSDRTEVKILKKKKFLDISQKKFGSAYAQSPRKCSNIEILAKIEGNILFENLQRAYKNLIKVLKKFKIISCLCSFKFNIQYMLIQSCVRLPWFWYSAECDSFCAAVSIQNAIPFMLSHPERAKHILIY